MIMFRILKDYNGYIPRRKIPSLLRRHKSTSVYLHLLRRHKSTLVAQADSGHTFSFSNDTIQLWSHLRLLQRHKLTPVAPSPALVAQLTSTAPSPPPVAQVNSSRI
jgi:hypothetical protein